VQVEEVSTSGWAIWPLGIRVTTVCSQPICGTTGERLCEFAEPMLPWGEVGHYTQKTTTNKASLRRCWLRKLQRLLATNSKLLLTGVLIFTVFSLSYILWRVVDYTNYLHRYLITHLRLFMARVYQTRLSSGRVILKRPCFLISVFTRFAGNLIKRKAQTLCQAGMYSIAMSCNYVW
jgi:hypothetical protein